MTAERPFDGEHALLCGHVAGYLMRMRADFSYDLEFLDDGDGNHLDTLLLTAPSGMYEVSVKRVPHSSRGERLRALLDELSEEV